MDNRLKYNLSISKAIFISKELRADNIKGNMKLKTFARLEVDLTSFAFQDLTSNKINNSNKEGSSVLSHHSYCIKVVDKVIWSMLFHDYPVTDELFINIGSGKSILTLYISFNNKDNIHAVEWVISDLKPSK